MRSLDMDGPFKLNKQEIGQRVTQPMPGNFALGRLTKDRKFIVRYIGRDDTDIRRALLGSLSAAYQPGLVSRLMGAEPRDNYFKFSLAQNPVAAFEKQCRQYHAFNTKGHLRNRRHPRPPANEKIKCPVCGEVY